MTDSEESIAPDTSLEITLIANRLFDGDHYRAKDAVDDIVNHYKCKVDYITLEPHIKAYIEAGYKLPVLDDGNMMRGGLFSGIKKAVQKKVSQINDKLTKSTIKDLDKKKAKLDAKQSKTDQERAKLAAALEKSPTNNTGRGEDPEDRMAKTKPVSATQIVTYDDIPRSEKLRRSSSRMRKNIKKALMPREASPQMAVADFDSQPLVPSKNAVFIPPRTYTATQVTQTTTISYQCDRDVTTTLQAYDDDTFDSAIAALSNSPHLIKLISFMAFPVISDAVRDANDLVAPPIGQVFNAALIPGVVERIAEKSGYKCMKSSPGEFRSSDFQVMVNSARVTPAGEPAVASVKTTRLVCTSSSDPKDTFTAHVIHVFLPNPIPWDLFQPTAANQKITLNMSRAGYINTKTLPLDVGRLTLQVSSSELEKAKTARHPDGLWGIYTNCNGKPVAVFASAVAGGINKMAFVYC